MSTLTVKLTHTNAGNTALNPTESYECNLVFATLQNLQSLIRDTGDHSGANLGSITLVESFCHGRSASFEQYTIVSGYGGDSDNSQGESNDAIQYFDITGIRSWAWSDFASDANLFIDVAWAQPADNLEVPCIGFRITYTPGARRGTSGFLALMHSAISFR